MRQLAVFVLLALAVVVAFTPITANPDISVRADLSRIAPDGSTHAFVRSVLPLPIASVVRLDPSSGDNIRLVLSTSSRADYVLVVVVTGRGRISLASLVDGIRRGRTCAPSAGATTCRIALRLDQGGEGIVTAAASGSTAIVSDIRIVGAASRERAGASSRQLLVGFGLLLLVAPLLAGLRRYRRLERITLVLLGLVWVGVTGWKSLVINLLFALAGYGLIHWIGAGAKGRWTRVSSTIAVVAAGLVFVKFVAPNIAPSFANPGGFWLALPLGVSYFAIRIVDLGFSVHSGTTNTPPVRDYLAFLFLPYTLPAGPILTYGEFLKFERDGYSIVDFSAGAARMAVGLTKKLVADAFLLPLISLEMLSFLDGGVGNHPIYVAGMLFANMLYVYLDFSAYCDLAIGAGRAAGYTIPENFSWPLLRSSIRSFWQSWHMTLTQWVMRRVYFPSFLTSRSVILSMFASMLVIGLWHAPTACWALWAAHHTVALATQARLSPPPGVGNLKAATVQIGRQLRDWVTYVAGVLFVWAWVSLGHSFTMFSSPAVALRCYAMAASLPIEFGRLITQTLGL
jgi:alginate O-acetyltransferase complex protein AlgI